MRPIRRLIMILIASITSIMGAVFIGMVILPAGEGQPTPGEGLREVSDVLLPAPMDKGTLSVEEAIGKRRSQRSFCTQGLTLSDVSQLLWAAQGITHEGGLRSVPSAGALYPLEILLVCGNITGLLPGVYRYVPDGHTLSLVKPGELRPELATAALNQSAIREAPATIVICAVFSRTTAKYGDRGIRYVHMEAGHASQNVYLQAESLGLGTVAIGAFLDEQVAKTLDLSHDETPLYLMPVGHVVRKKPQA